MLPSVVAGVPTQCQYFVLVNQLEPLFNVVYLSLIQPCYFVLYNSLTRCEVFVYFAHSLFVFNTVSVCVRVANSLCSVC